MSGNAEDAKKVKENSEKVLTNLPTCGIMYELARESTAPNLENDTETR